MIDFTTWTHSVLAVPAPTVAGGSASCAVGPSGHKAANFHVRRKAEADRQFIAQHGVDASIERTAVGWQIDPAGRQQACADSAPARRQSAS